MTAIDPSLLVYEPTLIGMSSPNADARIETLTFHRRMIRDFSHEIVMTDDLHAKLWHLFPWAPEYKNLPATRDLRQVLSDLAQRQRHIASAGREDLVIEPDDATCEGIADEGLRSLWFDLLGSCWLEGVDLQVATYIGNYTRELPKEISLAFASEPSLGKNTIPLVWDEASWVDRLSPLEDWPDLHRCVAICYQKNSGMQGYAGPMKEPRRFEYTSAFQKSIDAVLDSDLRARIVDAVTKRVYEILDDGLRDEQFGKMRRFRVSDFWRINYDVVNSTLVLVEFGKHDIGM